jgi:hypothetical protein
MFKGYGKCRLFLQKTWLTLLPNTGFGEMIPNKDSLSIPKKEGAVFAS